MDMIEVDGSQKSGSGTILRYAVSLASLLGQDLHITNIRAKRKNPGLRPQHRLSVMACGQLSRGTAERAEVGSKEIMFRPGKVLMGGDYGWDIGTAGSTTMLAMTVLPLALFADRPSTFKITGGLFQDFAPSAIHLQDVFFPTLRKMGIDAQLKIIRPGYVPKGGGVIELMVEPVKDKIKPLKLLRQGRVIEIKGKAISSHLKERKVSDRMAELCRNELREDGFDPQIEVLYDTTSIQKGAALAIYAYTDTGCIIGSDMAGKLGRTSEEIGRSVARNLIDDIKTNATVDRYQADLLIIYGALADGLTEYSIPRMTEHVDSNLWLIQEILGVKSEVKGNHLRIEGVGFHLE